MVQLHLVELSDGKNIEWRRKNKQLSIVITVESSYNTMLYIQIYNKQCSVLLGSHSSAKL